jgi:hypothetical protein
MAEPGPPSSERAALTAVGRVLAAVTGADFELQPILASSAASVPKSVTHLQTQPCRAPPATLPCVVASCHGRSMPAGC